MSENRQYSVLHEIGDYGYPQDLSEEDNKIINEQQSRKDSNKDDKKE